MKSFHAAKPSTGARSQKTPLKPTNIVASLAFERPPPRLSKVTDDQWVTRSSLDSNAPSVAKTAKRTHTP